jgi:hypothetical protein
MLLHVPVNKLPSGILLLCFAKFVIIKIKLDYSRLKPDYSRLKLDYSRLKLDYSRLKLDYSRF